MTPDEVLARARSLRRCAAAAAPASRWARRSRSCPRATMDKYLVCNADESEPGTFKDRELMQKNPHMLIEGIVIAACGGGHEPLVHLHPRRVRAAGRDPRRARSREARDAGYVGERHPRLRPLARRSSLHRGAGAYICGEETGLLDSLEGKRGNPRLKPPFPAIQGLYQGPTLINNVETLATVPHDHRAWAAQSTPSSASQTSTGTKLVSVSGHVQRPGNYEVELGIPSRELIYDLAGGPPEGRAVKCWFPGGSIVAGADRRRPRRPLRLRLAGQGRLDARLRGDHRRRRLDADPRRRAEGREVLPPRVLRQVHALPRGHQLDGEDARAHRGRRGDPDGPRHHGLGPGPHHRQLPVRARRRDGDADRLDDREVPRRVRGAHRGSARAARPRRGAPARAARRLAAQGAPRCRAPSRGRSPSRSTGARCRRPRTRCSPTRPSSATSRSRSSATSPSSASRSAPAACAWSRSRASPSSRPPARPRSRTAWSSTPRPSA